jgi:2-polyprenyl-3-methyl-5-hydroxy-6-metoxy-1,4-benzoquinol methylase
MGAHLLSKGLVSKVTGVDLAPDCVKRAKARGIDAVVGKVEQAHDLTGAWLMQDEEVFDAVSCFEVLEHVLDPIAVIEAAADCCKPGGRVYLSTPHGATEQGDLPNWAFVEHKGHVRAWLPDDFTDAVKAAGLEVVELVVDPDGLMLMEAKHA